MSDVSLLFSIFAKDKTHEGLASAESGFGKMTKGIVGKLAIAGAAIGGLELFKGFIESAAEGARVDRITEAHIKSTGDAAHVTAKQVSDLGMAISNKTGVDHLAIQSGENLLLTFTGVKNQVGKGNDVFNQATQAITDMTAGMNNGAVTTEGMKASSIQLGKALNDPVKGLTSLSRIGVRFTDQQKAQIKAMVASGNTLGAQKVILGELKTEFGGTAAASADSMTKLKTQFHNMGEEVGKVFLPIVEGVAGWLGTHLIPALERLGHALEPVRAAIKVFWTALSGGSEAGEFSGKLKAVNNAGVKISEWIRSDFLPAANRLGNWIKTVAVPYVELFAKRLWADLQPAIAQIVKSFRNDLMPAIAGMATRFKEAWPTIQRVQVILGQVAGFILTKVVPVLIAFYAKYLATVIKVMGTLFTVGWKIIGWLIDLGKAVVKAYLAWGRFELAVAGVIKRTWDAVVKGIGNIVSTVKAFPGKALAAVGNLATMLYQKGLDFIQGFIDGIVQKAKDLPGVIKDKIVGVATSALHLGGIFGSPSRLTMKYGRWFSEGFAIGIKDKASDVVAAAKAMIDKLKAKLAEVRDFSKAIRDAFVSSGDLSTMDTTPEGGGLLAQLQAKADAATAFASGIGALRKAGLNEGTLGQLRDSGPGSNGVVQQLLSGGQISQINALEARITAAGGALGDSEAKRKFGIDPNGPHRAKAQIDKVHVSFDFGGASEGALIEAIRKAIRVRGGDVQKALGS